MLALEFRDYWLNKLTRQTVILILIQNPSSYLPNEVTHIVTSETVMNGNLELYRLHVQLWAALFLGAGRHCIMQ